ncbi:uncharacterized protein LOC141527020 [Cotesia typhae]|uniref:uncharacterized protein LOC141527020 n=1 Tax=Cotesia typhae TaxID=2053667 RepID=UPI003D6891D9
MAKKEDLIKSATEAKILKVVKELLKNGSNINETESFMETPLHVAVRNGYDTIVKFLVENGASLDPIISGSGEHGYTPLHLAVLNGDFHNAKLLLEAGANPSLKIKNDDDKSRYHPIHIAVHKNDVEMVKLLCRHGADVNVRFPNIFFRKFKFLIHRSLCRGHDLPLLHYAILRKLTPIIKLLFEYKVDADAKTSFGKTALMQAVEVNSVLWVEYLVHQCHANVNDRDDFGQPVLHFTMLNVNRKVSAYSIKENEQSHEKLNIIKILRKMGANINARFPAIEPRSSIIHHMIKYGFAHGVQYLMSCYELNFIEIDMKTMKRARILRKYLTRDIQDNERYMNILRRQFELLSYHIIIKAIELRMIGLPADNNLIVKRPPYHWITMETHTKIVDSWKATICDQVHYMKNRKIWGSNITIQQLLTCRMSELIKLMSQRALRDFNVTYDPELLGKIGNYCKILKDRLSYAKKMKILLEQATEIISSIFVDHLPYDCCEKIVEYMVMDD